LKWVAECLSVVGVVFAIELWIETGTDAFEQIADFLEENSPLTRAKPKSSMQRRMALKSTSAGDGAEREAFSRTSGRSDAAMSAIL
jgi:hypothetical protein